MRRILIVVGVLAAAAVVSSMVGTNASAEPHKDPPTTTPIKHVVIIYQENHSFDNLFGVLCQTDHRCNGVTEGKISTGQTLQFSPATDVVPDVGHTGPAQFLGMDGGLMDGFDKIGGCGKKVQYRCYTGYDPSQFPNLATLARQYVIADNTFELVPIQSYPAHLEIVAATIDGFQSDPAGKLASGVGWGCDSGKTVWWKLHTEDPRTMVPSCVPDQDGSGPFEPSPVPWVPTIMDRMDAAGVSWRIYAPQKDEKGYVWSVCPTFADCLDTQQSENFRPHQQFIGDARAGNLPAYSLLIPTGNLSQHNGYSMMVGDNYIGDTLNAIMQGPDWDSTAVFITYDDCGCFYDHMPPPNNWGIRVPMVIVSPYAKLGYTDSTQASFASLVAFVERNWNLPALNANDANAYDFFNSFDFAATPDLATPALASHPVSKKSLDYIKAHPPPADDPG